MFGIMGPTLPGSSIVSQSRGCVTYLAIDSFRRSGSVVSIVAGNRGSCFVRCCLWSARAQSRCGCGCGGGCIRVSKRMLRWERVRCCLSARENERDPAPFWSVYWGDWFAAVCGAPAPNLVVAVAVAVAVCGCRSGCAGGSGFFAVF